jgi:hypothetical protein
VGDGLGDFVGLGDFDGDGLGLFDGLVLPDGLGEFDGLGDFDFVALPLGLGLLDTELLPLGVGVPEGLELLVGLELAGGVELAVEDGVPRIALPDKVVACTTAVDTDPHNAPGLAGEAKAGPIADPENKNSPAPAAAATWPARTTPTGTAALR